MKKNKIDLFFMPDLRPSALQKDVKKITVIHDLSFQHYKNFFSLKTRLWYKILNPKREIQTSNHLIAVSQYTKNDLLNTYRINENKITVIYEGIAKPITNITLADIRDRYKLPEKYFLFLSTIEPRKNIKNLIFGFLIYKKANPKDEIKLVIAGTENKKIFSKVSYDKHPDIHFTGFIDEKDKALLIKNAEAFVYPSFFEGFGLPLLEAMQAETPIITSHTSSMPEIAGDAAIFIDPAFPETIAQALEKIKDPALKNELKKNMKKQLEKFSWKKCAEETLMLFK